MASASSSFSIGSSNDTPHVAVSSTHADKNKDFTIILNTLRSLGCIPKAPKASLTKPQLEAGKREIQALVNGVGRDFVLNTEQYKAKIVVFLIQNTFSVSNAYTLVYGNDERGLASQAAWATYGTLKFVNGVPILVADKVIYPPVNNAVTFVSSHVFQASSAPQPAPLPQALPLSQATVSPQSPSTPAVSARIAQFQEKMNAARVPLIRSKSLVLPGEKQRNPLSPKVAKVSRCCSFPPCRLARWTWKHVVPTMVKTVIQEEIIEELRNMAKEPLKATVRAVVWTVFATAAARVFG